MDPETQTTASTDADANQGGEADVQIPDFQAFQDSNSGQNKNEISRFADIKVLVAAELGRTNLPIERLIELGRGSVVELDRAIDHPVELVAQGIPLASGEVVVVDGHFAVRILEVYPRNRRGESLKDEK